MKKLLLLCLWPVLSVAQTQIGNDIDGENAFDNSGFGLSISANGNVVAIGAILNSDNGSNAGHVRVYESIAGTWTQVGSDINGVGSNDKSGYRVSLSADGTIIAIGAPYNDGNGQDAGHVKVYENIAGSWIQVGADIEGEAAGDVSGSSISLSSDGSVLAIGSYGNYGIGGLSGHVRVFQNNAGNWIQIGAPIEGEAAGDWFGFDVSLSSDGTVLAIGAPEKNNNGQQAGQVRVYQNIAGLWTQVGSEIDGEAAGERSGWRVSLSADGNVLAIAAPENLNTGPQVGKARVYQNNAGNWAKIGNDILGEAQGDWCGFDVSLSADGTVVAVGAPHNEGNGDSAGHVRVFQNIAGAWTQAGVNIDGEASGDTSGGSVSLSADGKVVAIGAPYNQGNGNDSGHVRVYDLSAVLSSDSFVQTNFIVYPNPTAYVVTIQLNEGLQLEKVNVYTALGQLVKTETNTILSLGELAKGSYFVEVITNEGKATKTIMVE